MSAEEGWRLFFELTNEAIVVAESIGDYTLAELASAAAEGAADRLGLSHNRIIAMRQVLRKRASVVPRSRRGARPQLRLVTEENPVPLAAGADRPRNRAARRKRPRMAVPGNLV